MAALAAALAVSGCSTATLAYQQSDTLVWWWLDGYLDFDRAQAPGVKAALAETLAWHRQHGLPGLANDLDRLGGEVLRDASAEQACDWWQRLLVHRDTLLEQAAPRIAEVAATLSPGQILHLERRLRERDDKWRKEHLQPDLDQREREQLDRLVERLERLYGSLTREQRGWLGEQLRASPWDPQRWLGERQTHQRITVDSLRQIRSKAGAAATGDERVALTRRWLQRATRPSSETARVEMDRLVRHQCGLSANFHNRTSTAQRQHAAQQLADWGRDARRLMTAGDGPGPAH